MVVLSSWIKGSSKYLQLGLIDILLHRHIVLVPFINMVTNLTNGVVNIDNFFSSSIKFLMGIKQSKFFFTCIKKKKKYNLSRLIIFLLFACVTLEWLDESDVFETSDFKSSSSRQSSSQPYEKMKRWGRLKISPTKFHQWVSFSCQWSDKMYLDQGITVIIIRSPIKDICQKNEKYSQWFNQSIYY